MHATPIHGLRHVPREDHGQTGEGTLRLPQGDVFQAGISLSHGDSFLCNRLSG